MNKETSYCCLGYVSDNAILLGTGHLVQGGRGAGGGVLQNGKIAGPKLLMPPPPARQG